MHRAGPHSDTLLFSSLKVGGCQLHYRQSGNGPNLVLAFHGYGNNADMFAFLQHPDYTVISIDLPFHGNSSCNQGSSLTKSDLKQLVEQLMAQRDVDKVALTGYSMGGRVCLVLAELLGNRISHMVLLAPDGLRFNYFYYFLTHTALGRFLFRDFTERGDWYIRRLSWIERWRLISKSKYKFAIQQISTPENRAQLRNAWTASCRLVPELSLVRRQLKKYKIPLHLLMGSFDRIIPLKMAQQFRRKMPYVQLHSFQRGHVLADYNEVRIRTAALLFNMPSQKRNL